MSVKGTGWINGQGSSIRVKAKDCEVGVMGWKVGMDLVSGGWSQIQHLHPLDGGQDRVIGFVPLFRPQPHADQISRYTKRDHAVLPHTRPSAVDNALRALLAPALSRQVPVEFLFGV